MKKKYLVLITSTLAILSALLLPNSALAATVPDSVKYKAAYEGIWNCLSNGAYQTSFLASEGGAGMLKVKKSGDMVKLPYGLTDAGDNNTNCKEILKGFKDDASSSDNLRAGLLQAGMWSETDKNTVKKYFAGSNGKGGNGTMGYQAQGAGDVDGGQTTSKLTIALDTERLSSGVCLSKRGSTTIPGIQSFYDSNGNIVDKLIFPTITKNKSGNWFFGNVASNSTGINVPKPGSGKTSMYYFCNDDSFIQINDTGSTSNPSYEISVIFTSYYVNEYGTLERSTAPTQFEVVTSDGNKGWAYSGNTGYFDGTITQGKVEGTGDFDNYKLTYQNSGTVNQAKETQMNTIRKLSNTSAAGYRLSLGASATYDNLKLTDEEIYSLYTYYVTDVFKYPVLCEGDSDFGSYTDSNSKKINWVSSKTCRINTDAPTAQPSQAVYGIDDKKHFTKTVTINDVVASLNALPDDISTKAENGQTSGNLDKVSDQTPASDDSDDTINCYASAGALGYIICPTIEKTGNAAQSIYETAIVDQLEFDSAGIISENDSLRKSWSFFRDLANIIFVILLAAVLFSQFTGFGITNYGIKKILPRLIVMVILVNLSFILCQVAVDVSNLLGHAFYNTFKNFSGASDNLGKMIDDTLNGPGGLFSTVSTNDLPAPHPSGVTTGLTIAGVAIALGTWSTWIIPLLIAVIGFIVSVVFFAILLSVRQAGIIILIALTPVAVVCYSLPNTKTIYDKWFKLFSNLLMVFPIAGLVMGGGIWASNLMLQTGKGQSDQGLGGFFFALTAMLLQVIPFFFVPTLVKGSLAAAGQIGTRIASMGDRLGGNLQRTARNSNLAKDTQERMSGWRANRKINPWYKRDTMLGNSLLGRGRNAISKAGDRVRGADNRFSRVLNSGHNRKMNRLGAAALAADLNNRDRTAAYAEKHVQEIAKDFSGQWKNEGKLDVDSMESELQSAIADLSRDSTDVNAKGRYLAAMTELNKTGGGRDKVGQSLLNAVGENGPRANRGIQWAYNTLLGESGDLYKRKNSYTLANAQDFSKAGDFDVSKMVKNSEGNWVNKANIGKNLDDISAQRIADMDKSELERYAEMAQHAAGEQDEDGNLIGFEKEEMRNKFISSAMAANTNPNVTIDGDKAKYIDKIANANYVAANAGNDSASTVSLANIKSMANSSQAALNSQLTSIQNGSITGGDLKRLANVAEATLNEANAGRVNITQETADKLNSIRAADQRTEIRYARAEINVPHDRPTIDLNTSNSNFNDARNDARRNGRL